MIRQLGNTFVLDTEQTSYVFRVLKTGHLEHLYYGKRVRIEEEADAACMCEQHSFAPGNTTNYDADSMNFTLEDIRLEMSSLGKGDIRDPFVEITHADGSSTSDFLFDSAKICEGKQMLDTLPASYADNKKDAETLILTLLDKQYNLKLLLAYSVFPACNVITRSAKLENTSDKTVFVKRLMSTQLDFETDDFVMTCFRGAWAREMTRSDIRVSAGRFVNESLAGTSSSRANPFVMLSKETTDENHGSCYGLNLVYSGNHYEALSVSGHRKTRFVAGIHPTTFEYKLMAGESFEAPEAVMTFSAEGFNGMSQNMHHFVKKHIVRGKFRDKTRPILLNSWEAAYFDINENKLYSLARAARDLGMELFVMDDGWFGERNDDTSSLGDWEENKKKLPGGLSHIAKQVRKLGLDFGIWVEPEMVNVKSKLYKAHPEWVLEIPGHPHSEGRNQRILDLSNEAVQNYIIEEMSRVFSSAEISYVKWDMNRIFSDYFSQSLPEDKQGELAHRYVMGLYHCMDTLTKQFPDILFEGCSAGGNRFDLGILCYFPQIWGSDDTDALCRAEIQTGYSYGYPLSTVGAHVSACPNHQTLRVTPLSTRYNIAAFGVLGYECNLNDLKKEEREEIRGQIAQYKKWRDVFFFGDFYRGRSFCEEGSGSVLIPSGNVTEWTVVSPDRTKAVGMVAQKLVSPNSQFGEYKAKGLDPERKYHFYNLSMKHNVKEFGDLVNTVSPIHIKQDSLAHNLIAKFVKMDGEAEDFYAYGDTLMECGVKLSQAFSGTGYSDQVRHYQDFSSRMYYMEETKK